MPKRIPITTAKEVARKHGLRQIILLGYDDENTHIVTYGETKEECERAAQAQKHWKGTIREFSLKRREPERKKLIEEIRAHMGHEWSDRTFVQSEKVRDIMRRAADMLDGRETREPQ